MHEITVLTDGEILSICVLRLKVRVEPTADPCLLPTRTRVASAGRKNRLLNSTVRGSVDLGTTVIYSPLGTLKSRESKPATMTWYIRGLLLGLLNLTWKKRILYFNITVKITNTGTIKPVGLVMWLLWLKYFWLKIERVLKITFLTNVIR